MPGTAFNAANWTGYDSQSFTATASHTDFTLLIDVSTFTNDWKGYVQSNGADIRITKSDGTTELAYDLINWAYNAGAPTGFIRTLFSGASGTGANTIRVWAGYTGGTATAYADNETYGADNAYDDNWVGYWPLHDLNDRTANGWTLSASGGVTVGGVAGKLGSATSFDGTDDFLSRAYNAAFDLDSGTLMAWVTYTANTSFQSIAGKYEVAKGYYLSRRGTSTDCAIRIEGAGPTTIESRGGTLGAALDHFAGTWSASSTEVFDSGVSQDSDAGSITPAHTLNGFAVGSISTIGSTLWKGTIDDVQLHSTIRADEWIADEYAQSNNNGTWWGSWSWTAQAGGLSMAVAMHNYRRRRAH